MSTQVEMDIHQLIQHEGFVHMLTAINGRSQPNLGSLGLNAPRTTRSQEGLATFGELITRSIDLGRLRRIALRIQNFLAAPWLVADSDLGIILPRRLAEHIAKPAGLAIVDLPVDLGTLTLSQSWHARRHRDPAHAWLREVIGAAARPLDRAGTRRRSAKTDAQR